MSKSAWIAIGTAVLVLAVILLSPRKPGEEFSELPRGPATAVDDARLRDAGSEPRNWLLHGRTHDEQRHSPLRQINDGNVAELGLAWSYDLPTKRGLEATPIVVDGVMYTTGSWSLVYALDARTGRLLWMWDPKVPRKWGRFVCCDVVNRGVAVWRGKIYVATIDGRLAALDAVTGEVAWIVQTTPRDRPYAITGAPRVIAGKVLIGNAGAEYGVRGYVTAYDAESGEQLWRFYTVPGDPAEPFENAAMEAASKTWSGDLYWKTGGGGTVWDSIAYDPELGLVYIGVGNGSPWSRDIRSPGGGDNLYLSSIVALRADSGEYVWHYQTTPADNWDYTATQHMILADIEIGGTPRKVIMQAPKNGFFYVLDRVTGELISAEPYVHITWASRVDPETGRPVENTGAGYRDKPELIFPGPGGGHNWHPMSYHPGTGLVYIPVMDVPFVYSRDKKFKYRNFTWNFGVDMTVNAPPLDPAEAVDMTGVMKGFLTAWDPVAQKEVWSVQHTGPWNGGILTTAGNLVVQGTADGRLAAYRADSGDRLWQADPQTGIVAPPMTYMIDGEQYIAIMAGWGGAGPLVLGPLASGRKVRNISRVLAFKIGGSAELPPMPPQEAAPEPPAQTASRQVVALGRRLYHLSCGNCHGPGAESGGVISDLRHMDEATHAAFGDIVLGGLYEDNGMASLADLYSEEDVEAIHAYIIKRAHDEAAAAAE